MVEFFPAKDYLVPTLKVPPNQSPATRQGIKGSHENNAFLAPLIWIPIHVDDLPDLHCWMATMAARPACARGVQVPEPFSADEKVVKYFKRIQVG